MLIQKVKDIAETKLKDTKMREGNSVLRCNRSAYRRIKEWKRFCHKMSHSDGKVSG
jgi:hypothetical protein